MQLRRLKREFDHMETRYGERTQRMITAQCEKLHHRLYHERFSYDALTKRARRMIYRYVLRRLADLFTAAGGICLGTGLLLILAIHIWRFSPDMAWRVYFILTFVLSLPASVWFQWRGTA